MTVRKQLAVGALVLAIVVAVAYGATRYLRHELFPVELGTKAPKFHGVHPRFRSQREELTTIVAGF
jgi:hypothetical protein